MGITDPISECINLKYTPNKVGPYHGTIHKKSPNKKTDPSFFTKNFRYLKWRVSKSPYFRLFWGWVFPYISSIHTAYIGEASSIFGTTAMFGDFWRLMETPRLEECFLVSDQQKTDCTPENKRISLQ